MAAFTSSIRTGASSLISSPTNFRQQRSSGALATSQTAGAAAAPSSSWRRLGTCAQVPLVLVAGLSHQPEDDTLVAATMGRGVYVMHGLTQVLVQMLLAEAQYM